MSFFFLFPVNSLLGRILNQSQRYLELIGACAVPRQPALKKNLPLYVDAGQLFKMTYQLG